MNEEQINILIADTESFIYFQQKKINKIIESEEVISIENVAKILRHFSDSLDKISKLLGKVMEINSNDKLGEIYDISISTLAWIVYTFPSLEIYTSLFPENFSLRDKDVLDFLAYNMMELENIMNNPKSLKSFSLDISDNLREVSALFGHLSELSEKSSNFN